MQETQVQPLGWEDALEKGMATRSNILAWRIPMDRGAWRAIVSPWGCKESGTTEHTQRHIQCYQGALSNVSTLGLY